MASSGTMTTTAAPALSSYSLHPFDVACLQTSDYWIWSWGAPDDMRTVLGDPQLPPSELGVDEDIRRHRMPSLLYARLFTKKRRSSDVLPDYTTTGTQRLTVVDMNQQGDGTTTSTVSQRTNLHPHALAVVYQTP
ncbi:hypothetical protein PG984_009919, partial [Apiospora sp. TS-2023a]